MFSPRLRESGFTLIEILLVVAIIAVLGSLAAIIYRGYIKNAATTELIDRIAMIREQVRADAAVHGVDLCANPSADLVKTSLADPFVKMEVVQHDLGYARPLALHVRADSTVGNPMIARELFRSMQGDSHLGPGPLVTDSAVSFTVLLTSEPCHGGNPTMTTVAMTTSPPAPKPAAPTVTPPPAKPAQPIAKAPPSLSENPCPPGFVFVPDDGQAFGGAPQTGHCEKDSQHRSDPYADVQCRVCVGPPQFCEKLHQSQTCSWPNNQCINHMWNHDDGTRRVERRCGNIADAREWYYGYSDNDRCTAFDESEITTLAIECVYSCTSDDCNAPLNPVINGFHDAMWVP